MEMVFVLTVPAVSNSILEVIGSGGRCRLPSRPEEVRGAAGPRRRRVKEALTVEGQGPGRPAVVGATTAAPTSVNGACDGPRAHAEVPPTLL